MRRCIGCRGSFEKATLVRIATEEGSLVLDPKGVKDGRGLYLCKSAACFDAAAKKKKMYKIDELRDDFIAIVSEMEVSE